jgi:hypothetical protein
MLCAKGEIASSLKICAVPKPVSTTSTRHLALEYTMENPSDVAMYGD